MLLLAAATRPVMRVHALLLGAGQGFGQGFDRWIENVAAGTEIEKALYRGMQLPGGEVLFRRSPRETVPALTELQQSQKTAALYSLRALEEEQALDFTAAERDWRSWADGAEDRVGAHLDLADFYERRLNAEAELAALEFAGAAPADAKERWTAVENERSWKAFERALTVVDRFGLGRAETGRIYAAWQRRYPQQPTVYGRELKFLLDGKDFSGAAAVIAEYGKQFPRDTVFPVKAAADLAVRRGQAKDGLAVYDARFEPLWPAELTQSYFALVIASRNERAFADMARARMAAHPDDLKEAARLFYLYQQLGQMDLAKAVLTKYRESKETRGAEWRPEELETLEKLFEAIPDYPEAARYAYALAAEKTAPDAERKGTVALARILLAGPDQPLRVGAGNLALYRNIATMDRGPGYLNGILSLFLNSAGPASEYVAEDRQAAPYFRCQRAAELIAEIDRRWAEEPARPALHTALMGAYGVYNDDQAVIREGTALLAGFPHFSGRVDAALKLADAYERTGQADKEFALYRELLQELGAKADGVPLGATGDAYSKQLAVVDAADGGFALPKAAVVKKKTDETDGGAQDEPEGESGASNVATQAQADAQPGARSVEYLQVLNRYLARLVTLKRLPEALTVLRGELDRYPQDPGLYERLADFLEQNQLNSHEEEVYQRAVAQFQETGWYAKLARFYLRQRRNVEYTELMHKVGEIFSGTELEHFLAEAPAPNASLGREVNRYAHERFPHDLRFVERLIADETVAHDDAAVEKLLWEHWYESAELRDRLFELLSRTRRLDATLQKLGEEAPEIGKGDWTGLAARNPAAERFWTESCLWQSHYEQGVEAANALATAYPADEAVGEEASSLYRSIAYFHAEDTDKAVAIEKRLLDANPADLNRLARIGDIYADRERFAEAAPYWLRMAQVHPGDSDGYLQSATVFWDYFDFASAQAQLEKGRTQLGRPELFGYQEGAIAESRGEPAQAVRAYTASAIANDASQESRMRLLELAKRPQLRSALEEGTGALLKDPAPSTQAIELRAEILEAEQRKDDLARELNATVVQTSSFDVLETITSAARNHALPMVEEAALRREIALTMDPVHKLELRYQLVDFLEGRNAAAAAQEADAIYREQGKILGVVRATVDFDWDHDRKAQAVTVLLESAQASYPELRNSFQLEAARKLADMGEYARGRGLLETLLHEKPLDADYAGAMADNLARAGDAQGLAAFDHAQLDAVKASELPAEEKKARAAQLRRSMIATSTQLGNADDAVDQYIELIGAYPEDATLAEEAALYAVKHKERDRLFGFYQKAITDSPRDPRWSIVLARLATAAEDDALAVDAYGKALKLRPERQDLYIAEAALDERLRRLDDAIALYRKLYVLSYRDPQWMEHVAELSARQGKNADAVKALETAWIENRPAKASNYFVVAERLEKWSLLDEARQFAEQGVKQAGSELLVSETSGAETYARILARERQSTAALARLEAARDEAPKTGLAIVAQQVVKQGPGAVTDDEWRRQRANERSRQAASGFASALRAMSVAAGEFYTPEEKAGFAALLRQKALGASNEELTNMYLPAAQSAGLADLTADLEWTLAQRQNHDTGTWLAFEKRRVQTASAAAALEKSAASATRQKRIGMLHEAITAYRDAGDTVGELRATELLLSAGTKLDGEALSRYYRLLLAQRPDELIRIAGNEDTAAAYLVRNGSAAQALAGIHARAADRQPVWRDANTALAGLYLRESRPEIAAAFATILDADRTIGEQVTHPVDRNHALAGEVWFYYGTRYAEYLDDAAGAGKDGRAEDFLDAELERLPYNADAYLRRADYAAETGRQDQALANYRHSLDLRADQPAAQTSIAEIEWKAGRHDEAIAAWNQAATMLAREIDMRRVPESFWPDFDRLLTSTSARGQFDVVRQQVDAMLRVYVARNGNYRVEPLLTSAYKANGRSADWLLGITASAGDREPDVLRAFLPSSWTDRHEWIAAGQLDRIYRRIVEGEERTATKNPQEWSMSTVDNARLRLVQVLIDEKKISEARAETARVPAERRQASEWLETELRIADADGTLEQLIDGWKKQTENTPANKEVLSTASRLTAKGSRLVRRYVYENALERHDLSAVNFLGLAKVDLEENDTAAAVELLKRLTLATTDMYADTDAAARLLEEQHHPAEALEFLRPLAAGSPWNAGYKVRVARAQLALHAGDTETVAALTTVMNDEKASYADRTAAAEALQGHSAPAGAGSELKLLAQSSCPGAEAASKPYFVAARVRAAGCASNAAARERLLREAIATAPDDALVRRQYIFAAFEANFDSRALVAAEPLFQEPYYYGWRARGNEDADVSDEPNRALTLKSLPTGEAAQLVRLASAAYMRRRDYASATRIVSMRLNLLEGQDADAERNALKDEQKRIGDATLRAAIDDAHAPAVRAELDQPGIVRPKLRPEDPLPATEVTP